MTGRQIIDLNKELSDLFRKEEMLGYFDFLLTAPGTSWAGLCKISRLREGVGTERYFSLLFLVDTPGGGDQLKVNSLFDEVDWDTFRDSLPGVEKLVAIPYASAQSCITFKEVYLYVGRYTQFLKPFVRDRICPAVAKALGCVVEPPVFWEDRPAMPAPAPAAPAAPAAKQSWIEKIKAAFEDRK